LKLAEPGGNFLLMTVVTMSEKGQIVVPKEIRDHRGFDKGTSFAVSETRSGLVILRPVSATKPKVDFIEALRRTVKGIEIPERHHYSQPRV
jgi:AbrB family looped-hinge helix DNA binding protein